jgi:chemotaxis protein MotB
MVESVLFRTGEAELTPSGIRVLAQVADALRSADDRQIWIQGHTDDSPIHDSERFRSNWELSTARSLSVVHYLQDEAQIEPSRLAAVGFGEHRPASSQRARNRRIEIVLFPRDMRVVSEQTTTSQTSAPTKGL